MPPCLATVSEEPHRTPTAVFSIPEEMLDVCLEYHTRNPSETAARVEKVLKYGLEVVASSLPIRKKEETGAAPIRKNTTLKISLKRPREEEEKEEEMEESANASASASVSAVVVLPSEVVENPPKKPNLKFVM